MSVKPTLDKARLDLMQRGDRLEETVVAVVANLNGGIAKRELKTVLNALNLKPEQGKIVQADGPGPGNVVSLFLEHENVTEVFVGLGQHGIRAEAIAKGVAQDVQKYLVAKDASGQIQTAVGEHLADQLLLPMALMGGGRFTTTDISQHTRTNIDIIRRFLDVDVKTTQIGRKCWTIDVVNPTDTIEV